MNDKLILETIKKADKALCFMTHEFKFGGIYNYNRIKLKKDAAKLKALAIKLDLLINDNEIDDLLG